MTEIEKIRIYNYRMSSALTYELKHIQYFVNELHESPLYSNLFDKDMIAKLEAREQSDYRADHKFQNINRIFKEMEKLFKFDEHLRKQLDIPPEKKLIIIPNKNDQPNLPTL